MLNVVFPRLVELGLEIVTDFTLPAGGLAEVDGGAGP